MKIWKLDCRLCESYLRGDNKAKVIKVIPGDKDLNIPSRMEHVADSDPHWSTTPEGVPLTPDEQNINKVRAEKGHSQLQQLQALAALQAAGLKIPDEAAWLLEQNFDPRIIRGSVVCGNGHDNSAGSKFCGECGITMANRGATGNDDNTNLAESIPLNKLHVAALKKMARDRGLPATGTKAQLLERLAA